MVFKSAKENSQRHGIESEVDRERFQSKRMDESTDQRQVGTGQIDLNPLPSSKENLYMLLYPLGSSKLADLLAQLGSQYPAIAEELRTVAISDPAFRKIFVRGLDYSTTEETLCAAFKVHGDIEDTKIVTEKTTGRSRGFGFITYKDRKSSQSAVMAPGKLIDGRMVVCHLASDSPSFNNPALVDQRKLYICGLSPETTTETLLDFFGKYGEIEEGSIAFEKDSNRPRGYGFVTYKTMEAAQKAILDPEKTLCGKELTVKYADNRRSRVMLTQYSQPPLLPLPVSVPRAHPVPMNPIGCASMNPVGFSYVQPMAAYPRPPVGPAPYPRISYLPHFAFSNGSTMASSSSLSSGSYPMYGPEGGN